MNRSAHESGSVEPYYERDGIVIYLGDCREVLPTLAKGSADLLVTDPPYGMSYQSNRRAVAAFDVIAGDDDASWVPGVIAQACRVVGQGRHSYIFGPRELVGSPLRVAVELVWDKGALGMGDLSLPWSVQHEPITFAINATSGGGSAARLRTGSVLSYPRPRATRHPTEKPVALLRRLIESSSRPGETVLDPFLGSGSTLVAAIAEGRTGVGMGQSAWIRH